MKWFLPFLTLGVLALTQPAQASLICQEPAVVAIEVWSGTQRLVPELNLAKYYPDRAARQELEAEVLLDCSSASETECSAILAGPADYSFEAAARKVVQTVGRPDGPASIRVVFRVLSPPGKEIPCKPWKP